MKKLHLTQDEICDYGRCLELFAHMRPLLEFVEDLGGELPEELWECTENLESCLREVKEKTLKFIRSKDKLIINQEEEPDESDWEYLLGINK